MKADVDPKREKYLQYMEKKYGRPMPRPRPPLKKMRVNAGVVTVSFWLHAGDEGRGKSSPCCSGKLHHRNGKGAEVHLVVSQSSHEHGWVKGLTQPGEGHRYAVFKKPRH